MKNKRYFNLNNKTTVGLTSFNKEKFMINGLCDYFNNFDYKLIVHNNSTVPIKTKNLLEDEEIERFLKALENDDY